MARVTIVQVAVVCHRASDIVVQHNPDTLLAFHQLLITLILSVVLGRLFQDFFISRNSIPAQDVVSEPAEIPLRQLSAVSSVEDGVNGVHRLEDEVSGAKFIFKPRDEEAYAPGNTKNRVGEIGDWSPLKKGHKVGSSVLKEVAAFLMDHDGFAGVPFTEVARVPFGDTIKEGSLQTFVDNCGSAEDFSDSKFSVRDVHAIGLLDIRLANLDRHSGNMLVVDNGSKLVPIDHGYSLPHYTQLSDISFDWISWKHAAEPFSDEEKTYVRKIDFVKDAYKLLSLGLEAGNVMTYILSTIFLKVAVEKNLTLSEIGSMMQRSWCSPDSMSQFESIVSKCLSNYQGIPLEDALVSASSQDTLQNFLHSFAQECVLAM